MLAPTTTTIEQLPAVTDPAAELPDGLIEVETASGPNGARVNKKTRLSQVFDTLGGTVPGPNLRRDAVKLVRYRTKAEAVAAGLPNAATLEGLANYFLSLQSEALVELFKEDGKALRKNVPLRLEFDSRPAGSNGQLLVFLDGNFSGDATVPAHWVEATLPGPNQRRGDEKLVRWLTYAEEQNFGGSSLEGLDVEGLCIGEPATVEHYIQAGQPARTYVQLRLVADDRPSGSAGQLLVYRDGTFDADRNNPARWVEVGSPEEAAAGVRRYAPSINDWQADETTKILFSGDASDSFFTLLQAGGPFPSPVKGQTDAYYRPAAAPPPSYQLPGPNLRRDGVKKVRWLTYNESQNYGGSSLEGLDPAGLCIGAEATVEHYLVAGQPARTYVEMRLLADTRPAGSPGQLLVYRDGNFDADQNNPARWVEVGSTAESTANVPLLNPQETGLKAGDLRKYQFATGQPFYLFSAVNAGGPFAVPPDYNGNGDWQAVAPPLPATVLYVSYPLGYVQHITLPQQQQKPGVLFGIPGPWNGGADTLVEVEAGKDGFSRVGTLVSGSTRTPVAVDVVAGTYMALGSDIWQYLGDPANLNISVGAQTNCVYSDDHQRNVYFLNHLGNQYGESHVDNQYGNSHANNTYGDSHVDNRYGAGHSSNTYGSSHRFNEFSSSHSNNVYGDNCTSLLVGPDCSWLQVGDNCQQVRIYSCNGTQQQPFVIPAGTVDAEYRNNQLVQPVSAALPRTTTQTANYTLATTDAGQQVPVNGAYTVTIPPDTVALAVGTVLEVSQESAGQVTIAAGSGVVIQSAGGGYRTPQQYDAVALHKIGANLWRLKGAVV